MLAALHCAYQRLFPFHTCRSSAVCREAVLKQPMPCQCLSSGWLKQCCHPESPGFFFWLLAGVCLCESGMWDSVLFAPLQWGVQRPAGFMEGKPILPSAPLHNLPPFLTDESKALIEKVGSAAIRWAPLPLLHPALIQIPPHTSCRGLFWAAPVDVLQGQLCSSCWVLLLLHLLAMQPSERCGRCQ